MRLPKKEAFALAYTMAAQNPDTTAFYRFADFQNYYPQRLETDRKLYESFVSLGGKPKERHPLSFVLQGSDYLNSWFDNGITTKIPLKDLPSEFVSFTYGDSVSTYKRKGTVEIFTKEKLISSIESYSGTLDDFMRDIEEKYHYIEVQIWNDEIIKNGEDANEPTNEPTKKPTHNQKSHN
jgi:hypothetical protein